ncbi:hypothetical protein EQG67_01470 [Kosakonia cowanii]|nr:hypothetical protein EQG67_01470 [Kosakonia cowanii]
MIIIAMRSGKPYGNPESTTLLTLLPVFLSQPGAGFFFTCYSAARFFSFSTLNFATGAVSFAWPEKVPPFLMVNAL